jgi:thioredoxin reductase (NADPH)
VTRGEQVALIICYEPMREMPGTELLARTRPVYPGAGRILLVDFGDQRMLEVIARGMALGHAERYLTKPWRPRQHLLYPVVGETLAAWTRANWPGFELVRIVGGRWDPASFELRDALERNNVPYGFYDRGSPEGAELLQQLEQIPDGPVVFLPGGRVLTSYTQADIAEAVGGKVRPKAGAYDLVVVGAGPAGLSAAVCMARPRGLSTLVLERLAMGGQAGTSSRIGNFLGFPSGISDRDRRHPHGCRSGCTPRSPPPAAATGSPNWSCATGSSTSSRRPMASGAGPPDPRPGRTRPQRAPHLRCADPDRQGQPHPRQASSPLGAHQGLLQRCG